MGSLGRSGVKLLFLGTSDWRTMGLRAESDRDLMVWLPEFIKGESVSVSSTPNSCPGLPVAMVKDRPEGLGKISILARFMTLPEDDESCAPAVIWDRDRLASECRDSAVALRFDLLRLEREEESTEAALSELSVETDSELRRCLCLLECLLDLPSFLDDFLELFDLLDLLDLLERLDLPDLADLLDLDFL